LKTAISLSALLKSMNKVRAETVAPKHPSIKHDRMARNFTIF
jgi:hypothetical protein